MSKSFIRFYQELMDEPYFERMALDPLLQFVSEQQPLLGASLLPEQLKMENAYKETQMRFRTLPAVDGTRYSPTVKNRSGQLVGEVTIELGETSIQQEFTGQDHDGLVKLLETGGDAQATANLINWVDRALVRPHVIKNEIQRWQAMLLGQVNRLGADGYTETVSYYQEAGHVITVAGGTVGTPAGWHDPAYDIFADISSAQQLLEDLGYMVRGVYATGALYKLMQANTEIGKRTSRVVVDASGQIQASTGRVTMAELNAIAQEDGLPAFTKYNAGYESETGFKKYMDVDTTHDYMLLVGSTTRMWDMATDYAGYVTGIAENTFIDGSFEPLQGTLGYYGIGRNVGAGSPGRTVVTELQTRKPIGLFGEAYQTGLPVILEPQALVVLKIAKPTA